VRPSLVHGAKRSKLLHYCFTSQPRKGWKATWKKEVKLPWREVCSPNHHDDIVDSDQQVVNKELSIFRTVEGPCVCPSCVHGTERNKLLHQFSTRSSCWPGAARAVRAREFFIDNLLVRIHLIIEMILSDRLCATGV
jgi:hypothetical protein